MEPCLFRHGKEIVEAAIKLQYKKLQWSHVFSDMVSESIVQQFSALAQLQWSHVFSDMVSRSRRDNPHTVTAASMEPCLFRHGKDIDPERREAPGGASMEPCLFRHGKRPDSCTRPDGTG